METPANAAINGARTGEILQIPTAKVIPALREYADVAALKPAVKLYSILIFLLKFFRQNGHIMGVNFVEVIEQASGIQNQLTVTEQKCCSKSEHCRLDVGGAEYV